MAYAEVHAHIRPSIASEVVVRASSEFGFALQLVHADNGPEYSRYFGEQLTKCGITVRHSRPGRPNENAQIERFNRTIQEECLGHSLTYKTTNKLVQVRLAAYPDYYNTKRIHLDLQCLTPAEMLRRS
jgi:putative transposase